MKSPNKVLHFLFSLILSDLKPVFFKAGEEKKKHASNKCSDILHFVL